jgi:hypothetical protein
MIKHKCGILVEFSRFSDYIHAKKMIESSDLNGRLKMEPDGIDILFFINDDKNKQDELREELSVLLMGMTYTMKNVW